VAEIHTGPDKSFAELSAELEALDLVYDKDFWLHYTWDLVPYAECTEQAYQTWQQSLPDAPDDAAPDDDGAAEADADADTQDSEDSSDEDAEADSAEDTESGDSARAAGSRRATKRR